MTSFRRDAAQAMLNYAIPYLDRIQTIEDLIPTIKDRGMKGIALALVGRTDEAKICINEEIGRLSALPRDKYGEIERALKIQKDYLEKACQ